MDSTQTKQSRYGAPGIDSAAPLATREERAQGLAARAGRGFASWLKTAVIVLGGFYVVGWFLLTTAVSVQNRFLIKTSGGWNTYERILRAEPMRAFRLPADPRITAMQGGIAFDRLQPGPLGAPTNGFAWRDESERAPHPWVGITYTAEMFPGMMRSGWYSPLPSLVIRGVGKGYTAKEKAALRVIGTAPIWKEFDVVARAGPVDFVGGRLKLPFGDAATFEGMPLARFGGTREVANAAIARAAWHLSEGRRDSAEIVLKAVVSLGFALIDHGSYMVDNLVGAVIVGLGRDGLAQLYEVTGDSRAAALRAEVKVDTRLYRNSLDGLRLSGWENARAAFMEMANDASLPRGIRVEALRALAATSCGSGKEIAFGMSNEVEQVFAKARADLARFPSERAVIDLARGSIDNWNTLRAIGAPPAMLSTIEGLGRLYFNPRLANCALSWSRF